MINEDNENEYSPIELWILIVGNCVGMRRQDVGAYQRTGELLSNFLPVIHLADAKSEIAATGFMFADARLLVGLPPCSTLRQ